MNRNVLPALTAFLLAPLGALHAVDAPKSVPTDKPNLVVIVTDEHNFRTLGCYRALLPKDPRYGHYQPLGDLRLTFDPWDAPVTGYRRQLDLNRAVATTSFRGGDATSTREAFASAPDQVENNVPGDHRRPAGEVQANAD